ncbi:adenylate/guanylate cyclase domain-containing protein [Skermanella rosea]|uniref:CHASE2 domain-containing protein n=1 Tax=Skermanella rosea TaxID=1817965 RepID=UPI001931DCE7|nr:adenylate/guanylate cyclase domain-containing protein [Skermanella rosea]UEM01260.1 adenylate/guanylate cyclase domain-containing protein [Skermanella rosea]
MGRRSSWLLAALAVPLVLAGLRLADAEPGWLQGLEGRSLTLRYGLRGPLKPSGTVALLMIDDRTLAEHGRWPLSRRLIADAVRRLAADGARVVAIDLLFPEPEAPLPAEVADILDDARSRMPRSADGLAVRIDRLLEAADPDGALAAALGSTGIGVLGFAFGFDPDGTAPAGGAVPDALRNAAFRVVREPAIPDHRDDHPASVVVPVPVLARSAALGHLTVRIEADGVLRHDQSAIRFGDAWYPSLPVEAVRRYRGLDADDVALHVGHGIRVGPDFVATDRRMRLPVNHYGPRGTIETRSLADLLAGRIPPGSYRGRIVLIGASAQGVGDSFHTPFGRALPGAEHLATVIDNLLTGRTPKDRSSLLPADIAAILGGGLLGAALGSALAPVAATAGTAILVAGWLAATAVLFATADLWLAVTSPVLAAGLGFALFAARRSQVGEQARRLAERQRRNLMRYFSPAVAERLMNSNRPGLEDRIQPVTILFVDLVGFTGINERLSPREAMDVLRGFYGHVEAAVLDRGGVVDKFLGDGAMAIFGIPEPTPHDAGDALAAARQIADGMEDWNRELASVGLPALTVAMGLHLGPVLIGDTGGTRQFTFTIIGDAVNVASRLEALTRELGVTIAASDAVIEAARSTAGSAAVEGFVELPPRPLRGRERPIGVWSWPAPVGTAAPHGLLSPPDQTR